MKLIVMKTTNHLDGQGVEAGDHFDWGCDEGRLKLRCRLRGVTLPFIVPVLASTQTFGGSFR